MLDVDLARMDAIIRDQRRGLWKRDPLGWLRLRARDLYLWFRWRRNLLITTWKRRRGIPIYMRCGSHKDFGGKCEGEATWAIEKTPDYPIVCDECNARDDDPTPMVRLGRREI
jgi:hypothetical protein